LADRTEDGVDAHGSGDKNLDLNLATIRYEIDQERKKKGVKKQMSPEDYFMMT